MITHIRKSHARARKRILKMAARTRSLQPTNARPSSAVHGEGDSRRSESPVASKLFGTLLIATGIVLYVYILYIILANLLYPSSLAPFLRRAKNTLNATDSAQGKRWRFTIITSKYSG